MTRYGFRVYKLRITRQPTPRNMAWDEIPGGGYLNHLRRIDGLLTTAQGGDPSGSQPLTTAPFAVGATWTDIDQLQTGQELVPSNPETPAGGAMVPVRGQCQQAAGFHVCLVRHPRRLRNGDRFRR